MEWRRNNLPVIGEKTDAVLQSRDRRGKNGGRHPLKVPTRFSRNLRYTPTHTQTHTTYPSMHNVLIYTLNFFQHNFVFF